MSVSTISNVNALNGLQQSLKSSVGGIGNQSSSFAALLNSARQAERENFSAGNFLQPAATNNTAVENTANTTTNAINNDFGLADLYLYNSLQATSAQSLSSVTNTASVGMHSFDINEPVNLENLTLDFTALLPQGIKTFMKDLNCSSAEMNNFVNLMAFGTEDGPQGKNAAEFFGKTDMSTEELAASVQDILQDARINTWDVTGQDFNFVLSNQGAAIGQTLAVEKGLSLDQRALERDLDSTYEKDMALMQILSRTNNQSASIF